MFSNTLSFLSSRNVSDQVSHPYKTTGKIIIVYITIFKVLNSNLEDKIYNPQETTFKTLPLMLFTYIHTKTEVDYDHGYIPYTIIEGFSIFPYT